MPPSDYPLAKKYCSKAQNAATTGHAFEIDFPHFKRMRTRKTCALTQVPMDLENSTIDRVDCNKGYLPDNVLGVRDDINSLKGQLEFAMRESKDINWYTIQRLVDNTIKHLEGKSNGSSKRTCRSGYKSL